eukprot:11182457-Lingulodinium_polyedra.AAC.1
MENVSRSHHPLGSVLEFVFVIEVDSDRETAEPMGGLGEGLPGTCGAGPGLSGVAEPDVARGGALAPPFDPLDGVKPR